jgi:hypothetical protein
MGFILKPADESMKLLEYIESSSFTISAKDSMIAVRQRLDKINESARPNGFAQFEITPIFHAIEHERPNLLYALIVYGANFKITFRGQTPQQKVEDLPATGVAKYMMDLLSDVNKKGEVKNWTLDPQSCPFKSYEGESLVQLMSMISPPLASSAQASSASSAQASSARASSPLSPPAYDNARKYAENDVITFEGKIYKLKEGIGAAGYSPATHPRYWTEVTSALASSPRAPPAYENAITYYTNDIITFNGKVYRLREGIGAAGYSPATHPQYWTEVRSGGYRKSKKAKRKVKRKTKGRKRV